MGVPALVYSKMTIAKDDFSGLLKELTDIGVALSAEKDHTRLLEMILFESLSIHQGGTSGEAINFPPIALHDEQGNPNNHMVAAWAALHGETVNIGDAYSSEEFDFSGTRKFDEKTGYRSKSFLTVPMTNHENEITGVLQLINATENGEVVPFSALDRQLVESLASQAAVTMTNRSLIDEQKKLFDALIQLIADAIDEKSPYTAGHCRRVPVLTNMLAEAACRIDTGPLKDFQMTDEEKYEVEVAAWLHDCGKITTPEYVVDKGTKLETIFDRIHLVDTRFEVIKRDTIIAALLNKINKLGGRTDESLDDAELNEKLQSIDNERDFIRQTNVGGEFLSEDDKKRIEKIGGYVWNTPANGEGRLLSKEEIENLQIGKGTLSLREREIINNHVSVTIKMLESLPYPKHLRRVPEYAGGHHEKMDGTGYPNKLTREQMSIPARMVAIADVFEALTASDRPYKKAMTLSQSLTILGRMKEDRHVDADLFNVFVHDRIYLKYAEQYLAPKQIDDVDIHSIPGYEPL